VRQAADGGKAAEEAGSETKGFLPWQAKPWYLQLTSIAPTLSVPVCGISYSDGVGEAV
jgi:hypothetical protein